MIPSILLATDPIWKGNVRDFCNHYRQDTLIMQVSSRAFVLGKKVEGKK